MRQALALLSDGRAAESGPPGGASGDRVPPIIGSASLTVPNAGDSDDADTFPLPVILPGGATTPRPKPVEAVRGPFEPARPNSSAGGLGDTALREPAPADTAVGEPAPDETATAARGREMPAGAEEKLDQIKDLLFMAEAIGEQNLDRHFDQVSQRQRELIREFFDRAVPNEEQDA